jgi:hypothetical protein
MMWNPPIALTSEEQKIAARTRQRFPVRVKRPHVGGIIVLLRCEPPIVRRQTG